MSMGADGFGRLRFYLNRLRERLWVKPAIFCVISIGIALLAGAADRVAALAAMPQINAGAIETLLTIMSSSMLVMAVFAAGAMVAAYASAAQVATPRTFPLVLADDISQNALSTFIGAFIFSIIALIALLNDFYARAGLFVLFVVTIVVFALVVLSFVRWVDRIARLGRLGTIIEKVEAAAGQALATRRRLPTLGAGKAPSEPDGIPIHANSVGYVQRVDLDRLQACAEDHDVDIIVRANPGAFMSPDRALVRVQGAQEVSMDALAEAVNNAFVMGRERTFDEDPRFGLVVLSEIGSRALSPGINDPGTAIDIIGTLVRLFAQYSAPLSDDEQSSELRYPRLAVPPFAIADLLGDAFDAIARDGAAQIEVVERLLRALKSVAQTDDPEVFAAARRCAAFAARRADASLAAEDERERLERAKAWLQASA